MRSKYKYGTFIRFAATEVSVNEAQTDKEASGVIDGIVERNGVYSYFVNGYTSRKYNNDVHQIEVPEENVHSAYREIAKRKSTRVKKVGGLAKSEALKQKAKVDKVELATH